MITFKGHEMKNFIVPTFNNLYPLELNDIHSKNSKFSDTQNQIIVENAKNEAELIYQQILGNLNK